LTDAALRQSVGEAGNELTYTCVPPGSGERLGIDRDGDGFLDGDELMAGRDPADSMRIPQPRARGILYRRASAVRLPGQPLADQGARVDAGGPGPVGAVYLLKPLDQPDKCPVTQSVPPTGSNMDITTHVSSSYLEGCDVGCTCNQRRMGRL